MSATQTTTKAGYLKTGEQHTIINVTTCGIKCKSCNLFFEPNQLQKHFLSHIDPKYLKSTSVTTLGPQKISLANLLEDPEKSDDIWVKSMMVDDLPKAQIQRKKIGGPTGQYRPLLRQIYNEPVNFLPDCNKQIWSTTSDTYQSAQKSQEQLNIKTNVKLNRQKNQIEKKQLHVYMNQNTGVANIDLGRSKKKQQQFETQTKTSQKYDIQKAPLQQIRDSKVQGPGQKLLLGTKKSNRVTYAISSERKQPAHHINISTFSRYQPEKSRQSRSPSTIMDNQSDDNVDRNLQCPCCKGFYCTHCKSSIPPIYRPVPDKDGNYHFHPQQHQRALQFYQTHHPHNFSNLRPGQVCQQCRPNDVSLQGSMVRNQYNQSTSPNNDKYGSPASTRRP